MPAKGLKMYRAIRSFYGFLSNKKANFRFNICVVFRETLRRSVACSAFRVGDCRVLCRETNWLKPDRNALINLTIFPLAFDILIFSSPERIKTIERELPPLPQAFEIEIKSHHHMLIRLNNFLPETHSRSLASLCIKCNLLIRGVTWLPRLFDSLFFGFLGSKTATQNLIIWHMTRLVAFSVCVLSLSEGFFLCSPLFIRKCFMSSRRHHKEVKICVSF